MPLTSSYSRKDWATLSLHLLLKLALPFCGVLYLMFTLFMPMLEVMPFVIEILTQDELVVEIRDTLFNEGYNVNTILVYYIFTVSGGIVIPTIFLIWSMGRLLDLGSWIADKFIGRLKDPTVYWNGVPTTETKYGKLFKNKPKKEQNFKPD